MLNDNSIGLWAMKYIHRLELTDTMLFHVGSKL